MAKGRARSVVSQKAVPTSDSLLVQANPHRIGIILSNDDPASRVFVNPAQSTTGSVGTLLNQASPTMAVYDTDAPGIAAQEWRASCNLVTSPNGNPIPFSALGQTLPGTAVADVLTFTVPAGRSGVLNGATVSNFTGAPTVALRLVRGGTTVILSSGTGPQNFQGAINLIAGDVVEWSVTTLAAASTFDATLSGSTFLQLNQALSTAPVTITEIIAP